MKEQNTLNNTGIITAVVLCLAALALVCYYFQHATVTVGNYTVVYYKNQCNVAPEDMPEDFDSLTALPCLVRINWTERLSSDMEQEFCYLPDRGIEKTRLIHKSKK